jgi:hypothetical protein
LDYLDLYLVSPLSLVCAWTLDPRT